MKTQIQWVVFTIYTRVTTMYSNIVRMCLRLYGMMNKSAATTAKEVVDDCIVNKCLHVHEFKLD